MASMHWPMQIRAVHDRIQKLLNESFEAAKDYKPQPKDWLASHWEGFMSPAQVWIGCGCYSMCSCGGVMHLLITFSTAHAMECLGCLHMSP